MTLLKEFESRSIALERSYVHDVYENQFINSNSQSIQPLESIETFLANLETGTTICDVGCGDGKYLNSFDGKSFYIGVDKCIRVSKIAKNAGNEILICDNLSLPFRDESFDVVLSISVIHHFASNERRICALRELSRILRIGGKLLITVWALEPNGKNEKFQSQDFLLPWNRRPNSFQQKRTTFNKRLSSSTTKDNKFPLYFFNFNLFHYLSITKLKKGQNTNSNLSSPSETCYGFVKKALKKLAGRRTKMSKQWSWGSSFSQNSFIYKLTQSESNIDKESIEVLEDINNQPIELRCQSIVLDKISLDEIKNGKSKSMINLSYFNEYEENVNLLNNQNEYAETRNMKYRRLIKYKSMNDELIDRRRLLEKEILHKNLLKQTSFNEDLIYAAQRKFQFIKTEFTNKIKQQNLINIDRMNRTVIRSSFEKLLNSWKNYQNSAVEKPKIVLNETTTIEPGAVRHRRLSNSEDTDSSKDGSMFSESSMDSDESFISVIFNPNPRKKSSPTTLSPNGIIKNTLVNRLSPTPIFTQLDNARDQENLKLGHDNFDDKPCFKKKPESFVIFKQHSVNEQPVTNNVIKNIPKFYSMDLYNPAFDDNDSSSSSPNSESSDTSSDSSVKSVISVASYKGIINESNFLDTKFFFPLKTIEKIELKINDENTKKQLNPFIENNKCDQIINDNENQKDSDGLKPMEILSEEIEKHRKYLITLSESDEKNNQSQPLQISTTTISLSSLPQKHNFNKNDNNNNNMESSTVIINHKSDQNLKTLLPVGSSTESNDTGYISEKNFSTSDSIKDTIGGYSYPSSSVSSLMTYSSSKDFEKIDSNIQQMVNKELKQKISPKQLMSNEYKSDNSNSLSFSVSRNSNVGNCELLSYHKYYHLFTEGELDKLIEQYVDNLHIINSYYDQANWCIVAEKVQVWTI